MVDLCLSKSQEYRSFVSSVPKKKVVVDDDGKQEWTFYDAGPRSIRSPVIFLPPASGTADIFFKQILALSSTGYRALAVEYPPYWTLEEWYSGFQNFLDYLQLDTIHIFGASLGGFLAQKFAEHTLRKRRVASLILCNAFMDTSVFDQKDAARTFWMMPSLFLKKMVMGNFDKGVVDNEIASSIDFMVDKLDSLSQKELASRLTLNCIDAYVEPQLVNNQNIPITIIDVFDICAISESVKQDMYKCYPDAKRAHLKSGGNFPYLSRSDEVALYIKIHLKQFMDYSGDLKGPDVDGTQTEVSADDSSVMNGETIEEEEEEVEDALPVEDDTQNKAQAMEEIDVTEETAQAVEESDETEETAQAAEESDTTEQKAQPVEENDDTEETTQQVEENGEHKALEETPVEDL